MVPKVSPLSRGNVVAKHRDRRGKDIQANSEGQIGYGQNVLIADTIGFIQNLPPHLIESFKATLAEVEEADLVLHIIDSADPEQRMKINVVNEILFDLINDSTPVLEVYNKSDIQNYCFLEQKNKICISCLQRKSLEELKVKIKQTLDYTPC